MDREKVIKAFEECICKGHKYCAECYQEGPGFGIICRNSVCFDALALLRMFIEEAPTVGGWISVKDRLPEKSGQYLCWFGANKVVIGPAIETYVDEWKAFGDLISLEKYPNITHWMPLPEPPKEG